MTLQQEVDRFVEQFEISDAHMNTLVDTFVSQAQAGLAKDLERGMPMIPTFVTRMPNGSEKGLYLATDLGGTNFRVCSVKLNGDSTHDLEQMKFFVPPDLQQSTSAKFFGFLADCIEKFLRTHHGDHFAADEGQLSMGFTFSFPVEQTNLNRGTLIRWTKGFDIKDAVGKDVCELLQTCCDDRKLRVHVSALINDTVGALLSRSYSTGAHSQTVVGLILGTGTNAAYSEKLKTITKLEESQRSSLLAAGQKIMVVNTEWGSFDNDLTVLPNTEIDVAVNLATPNRDFHMFEKRVSGMFLGEIVRRELQILHQKGLLFADYAPSETSDLSKSWALDTSFPSRIEGDTSSRLEEVESIISETLGPRTSLEERVAIQKICHAVAKRAAYLSAAALAGLLTLTKAFEKFDIVDVGADGSVIEQYPRFEAMIRDGLRRTSIGDNEKRITMGISKDGSGVGAALCAAMAT